MGNAESRNPGFWKTILFQLHDYIKEGFITLLLKRWLSSKSCCRSSPNTADFDCWRLPLQSWFLWSDQMGQKQSLEHRLAIVCRMQMIPRLALSPWSGGEWGWSFVCSETYTYVWADNYLWMRIWYYNTFEGASFPPQYYCCIKIPTFIIPQVHNSNWVCHNLICTITIPKCLIKYTQTY